MGSESWASAVSRASFLKEMGALARARGQPCACQPLMAAFPQISLEREFSTGRSQGAFLTSKMGKAKIIFSEFKSYTILFYGQGN